MLRCEYTKNPCGTDTWAVGPCQCEPCRDWLDAFEAGRMVGRGESTGIDWAPLFNAKGEAVGRISSRVADEREGTEIHDHEK